MRRDIPEGFIMMHTLCRLSGLRPDTLQQLVVKGLLPAPKKINGVKVFEVKHVEEWLHQNRNRVGR